MAAVVVVVVVVGGWRMADGSMEDTVLGVKCLELLPFFLVSVDAPLGWMRRFFLMQEAMEDGAHRVAKGEKRLL